MEIYTVSEHSIKSAKKEKNGKKKGEHVALHRGATALAITFPSVIGAYALVRGGVSVFHHLRQKQLRQLLFDACSCMNDSGATWWLDFGALLGIYRDGDLIPHDNDLDVVVLNPDWDHLYKHLVSKFGESKVHFVTPSEDPKVKWIRVNVSFGMLDVFGGYDRGGPDIEVDSGRGDLWDIPKDLVLPLGEVQYRNRLIKVPGDIQGALRHRYGDTWHIPRYMDKGRDHLEQHKLYARILSALGHIGIKI